MANPYLETAKQELDCAIEEMKNLKILFDDMLSDLPFVNVDDDALSNPLISIIDDAIKETDSAICQANKVREFIKEMI